MIIANSADEAYKDLLKFVKQHGVDYDIRGSKCKEVINVSYRIEDIRNRIITEKNRKFPLKAALAEFLWYMTGDPRHEIITPYLKSWSNYSDDGSTVNSNYGFQWMTPYDQVKSIIQKIKRDPQTRQGVIDLYDKGYAKYYGGDNVCTPSFQVFLRENKLHMTVNARSRDLIRGECIDQFTFTMLQELMANELGVKPGYYQCNIGSLHVYETHYDLLDKADQLEFDTHSANGKEIRGGYSSFWKNYQNTWNNNLEFSFFIESVINEKNIILKDFSKYANF